jgi:phosphohistidine phosphatase SixA
MNLYLMRHAEAVSPSQWSQGDSSRPLTPAGIRVLTDAAEKMKLAGFNPGTVLCSPYERAQHTAKIVGTALGIEPTSEQKIASGARADDYKDLLQSFADRPSLLIVAHMPDVAVAAARLSGDGHLLERTFKTGEMVALEVPPTVSWGTARILWWRELKDWVADGESSKGASKKGGLLWFLP